MILEELLKKLSGGSVYNMSELATDLDVDVELLEQMIHDLERAGYVEPVALSCEAQCDHCPYGSSTGPKQSPCIVHGGRIWTVTEKGWRAAQEA